MIRAITTHTGFDTRHYLVLKTAHAVHRLYFDEMYYAECEKNATVFAMFYREVRAGYCLKHFEPQFPAHFMRVHQSFIINRHAFDYYDNDEGFIYLKGLPGKGIPLGGTCEDAFFDWLASL